MQNILTRSEHFKTEYCCHIHYIDTVYPVENSDNLVYTIIGGDKIVLNKNSFDINDPNDKRRYVFYVTRECIINHKFLFCNNQFMYDKRELNSNYDEVEKILAEAEKIRETDPEKSEELIASTKKMCGYFDTKGRVRIKTLRGCPSSGYTFGVDDMITFKPELKSFFDENPIESFIKEGEEEFMFDTVADELFVWPYVPKVNVKGVGGGSKKKNNKKIKQFNRIIPEHFSEHYNTAQLGNNMFRIKPDDVVDISVKMHGCVDGDTIVNTEYGDMTIRDIVENKKKVKVKAYDTNTNEVVYVDIDDYYYLADDGEWVKLTLEDGTEIIITENNPVWLPELETYRKVEDIKVGDVLLLNRNDVISKSDIVNIEKVSRRDRYDLTINSTHNFFANGVLIHNTSVIIGNILTNVPIKLPFFKRLYNKIVDTIGLKSIRITDTYQDYGNVFSTRRVIQNGTIDMSIKQQGYYDHNVYSDINDMVKDYIPKGYTIYGEIVGYTCAGGKHIQKNYNYGCDINGIKGPVNKLMIYRISEELEDGTHKEWTVSDVKKWSEELREKLPEDDKKRLEIIPVLYHGTLKDLYPELPLERHWNDNVLLALKNDKEHFGMEEAEPMCIGSKKQIPPREGIVLRIEVGYDTMPQPKIATEAFKLKTDAFFKKEAEKIDKGEVDMETLDTDYAEPDSYNEDVPDSASTENA